MAAEVPISDVLCEAMEYLCKLGTNIRARSESLKEKKIRKDKLKNSQAVLKAADKVLLICKLSKKSLENVENGVQRVLALVGNSVNRQKGKGSEEFQYFCHESFKLRISKKVLVSHYTSVKVLVRKMPISMQDKYPVYYNCKLYRERKKKELGRSEDVHVNMELGSENDLGDVSSVKCAKENDLQNKDPESIHKSDNISKVCSSNISVEYSEMIVESHCSKNTEGKAMSNLKDVHKSSEIENETICSKEIESKNDIGSKTSKQLKNKKFKHIRIIEDSSENSNDISNNDIDKEITLSSVISKPEVLNQEANITDTYDVNPCCPEKNNIENVDKEDQSCTGNPKDKDLNEDLKSASQPVIKCVSISKLLNRESSISHIDDITVNSDDNSLQKKIVHSSDEEWTQKRKEVIAFKPRTFSVDIYRMPKFTLNFMQFHNLKRIVQGCCVLFEIKTPESNDNTQDTGLESIDKVKNALLNDSESHESNDDTPSNINLVGVLSNSNNIMKSRDGNKDINEFNGEDISTGQELINNINQLKPSLIYESDSDCDEKIKENNSTDKNNYPNTAQEMTDIELSKQVKDVLLNESDSDKNEKTLTLDIPASENNVTPQKNCEIKNSLDKEILTNNDKDAADSKQKTPPRDKQKYIDSDTPRTKRKRIMESMYAKRMLLTYSSSDTEDENLSNALKEIKHSLLKGDSSNDEKEKVKCLKIYSSTSESDDNILDKIKEHRTLKRKLAEKKKNSKKIGRSRAHPVGSSQNSDSQDSNEKNINGLTNLKNLIKNRRRRDSTSTDATSDTNSVKKTKNMPKAPLISEEDLLNAESSSEVASGNESDVPDEDLPPVSMSGLNGTGSDHLAKDDLLDDSDSSTSHNENEKEEETKMDSDDDNNLKLKRRKMNAISSDSEVGSSRKKNQDARLSDFEDSEDESSDPTKKTKRKKKGDESDASAASSSNDGSKKKRRRIKQLDSEVSGSDTENEGRNKHGRKNIRKVMGKNQLEEATKKAAREEKERIARITERQKLYNNLEFDESGKPDEVVLEKVVLDFDPETKEPLIEVDRGLVKKLKPHQANGIKFMWNACFESVKRIKKDRGSGCILAHCMGLGKTLQVVSLTHTLLTHGDLTTVNRVLVVCPLSTVLNWVNEFNMWLKHSITEYDVDVYELSRYKQNSERAFQLQQWFEGGGVCVLGYEMFRNLSADNPKKFKKKMLRHFQEALVDPGPDLVVCDEGHLLKNEKTSLSQSMNRVKTQRRIVLTGTPLQNNLKEYYCMVQFVKPNLLGKYNEYLNRFVNPITNGQYTDSNEHDIRIMKRRSHVLHKMLDGAVQRRDYGVLAPFLPPKHEYVLFITLTEIQVKLYQYYLDNYSRRPLAGKSSGFLFPDFQSLQRIWTHPLVLKYNSERYEIMQQKKREREEEEDSEGSLADFIDDDSTPDESSTEESSDDLSDASDDSRKKLKKKKSSKKNKGKDSKMSTRRGTRANPVEHLDDDEVHEVLEVKAENPTEWWIRLVTEDELEDVRHSHKLVLLFDILRQCEAIGDKLLVFSQSLYSLDLIEHFLGKVDEATQEGRIDEKLGGHVGSWSPGIDYFRLDGSTSCENRSIWCKNFNREDNPRARLFLISTRAGGLGINLVAANRVVIFDVSWNPSHDVQSIFRVYRFGQKKPCYVYRFLAMGTMEEKIYERQVTKQAISKRVIDEQQIDRHYAENDLAELYKFESSPPMPRPLPPLPKDRLFAEMLKEHEAQIYKYHEHDSLLENKEEETLTEEERKAAWEDFENEKNRPPPAPFPSPWPMHNGMVPGLLAQQQQQLAYATLAAMLRKDMPNINDNQIRDMLPLIFNANPAMFGGYDYGLMQKMSEIYKYAPGAMMNPALMNQVMNPAGVGSGGPVGGSSGLQYSPPWQRQHQQQQQMRLQQLMQHQNQMGAKYYAGGLGSRDPVAMALQQQRAREIMAGEQARGRPRGRPPLPRVAQPPPGDVVNLDSD